MDLDRIQKSWARLDISVGTDTGTVREIIRGKVKTGLDRLITIETLLLFMILPLVSIPFIIEYLLSGFYILPLFIKLAYLFFCGVSFFWQGYKRQLLKQIDIANVGIVINWKYFLRYRLCIKYEIIVGTIFGLVLFVAFVYSWKGIMTDYQFQLYCRLSVVLLLAIVLLGVYFYRKIYYKRIKEIESSLSEIDNIER